MSNHVTNLRKMGALRNLAWQSYLFDKHALGNSDNES